MSTGVRCMIMRGGTSKAAYLLAGDVPDDPAERDDLLLRIVGSPDPRQIDGIGGAHPLTTKVAIVGASRDGRADVEYLFLQPSVDEAVVSDQQNCGNILAGVGPFALERGLVRVAAGAATATVRIHMRNTDSIATATFPVADGLPLYSGEVAISGVPGTAAPIRLDFEDIAGGTCGALLPTGNPVDSVAGVAATLIDNGMPVVVMAAADLGVTGYESPAELEANSALRAQLEEIRLQAGKLMNLGDVSTASVPKLTLVAPPVAGGDLSTRTFIPRRCHDAIGVLGAVSVATAAMFDGSPAAAVLPPARRAELGASAGGDRDAGPAAREVTLVVEHPTGTFDAAVRLVGEADGSLRVERAGIVRTARKLMDGAVFPR
ncbi:MAG: 4-oxalomesaconate tautomerase [Acidimicrobiia bacterium]|nr:4-oxalomesaconate tautomerase [Acidimicrobiia bacterium]